MRFTVFCALFLASCVSSVSYRYQPSLTRPQSQALQTTIAVADLVDNRDLIRPRHRYAHSFFLEVPNRSMFSFQKTKPYGLTHQGVKFTPVSRVMRDLLYQELSNAGAKVILLDTWGKNLSHQDLLRLAKEQGADYLLTGQINAFSVEQKEGLFSGGGGPFGNKKRPSNYDVEYRLSVARVSDGVSIWGFNFFDDRKERQRNINQILRTLFQDLLPPILVKGSGFTMDQIEIDIINASREPLPLP